MSLSSLLSQEKTVMRSANALCYQDHEQMPFVPHGAHGAKFSIYSDLISSGGCKRGQLADIASSLQHVARKLKLTPFDSKGAVNNLFKNKVKNKIEQVYGCTNSPGPEGKISSWSPAQLVDQGSCKGFASNLQIHQDPSFRSHSKGTSIWRGLVGL